MSKACLAVFAFCLAAAAPQADVVFRTGISVVSVDAQVTQEGRLITGLAKEDFLIADRGSPQTILYFGAEEEPLDLVLLLDTSGSMRPAVEAVARAGQQALAQLHRGDRVAVMIFKRNSARAVGFSSDLEGLPARLHEVVANDNFRGGTDLYGGIHDAAGYLRRDARKDARRSVLVITDNISVKSMRDSTVTAALWEADAVLNAIVVRTKIGQALRAYAHITGPWTFFTDTKLDKIVAQTGGESMEANAAEEAFATMIEHIRMRYRLYYRTPPGKAGERRKIEVRLAPAARARYPKAEVRARTGYMLAEAVSY